MLSLQQVNSTLHTEALGIYLLVLRQENPFTARGWARYTKEKSVSPSDCFSEFLSGEVTDVRQFSTLYHTFKRQSSFPAVAKNSPSGENFIK